MVLQRFEALLRLKSPGKHEDAPRLALDMGRVSPKMIFDHYREIVTPEEAELYWHICPPAQARECRADGVSVLRLNFSLRACGLNLISQRCSANSAKFR